MRPEWWVLIAGILGLPAIMSQARTRLSMPRHASEPEIHDVEHPSTREEIDLGIAKEQYVLDALSQLEFEQSVEHVLKGGTLRADGHIPAKTEIPLHVVPTYGDAEYDVSPFHYPKMQKVAK